LETFIENNFHFGNFYPKSAPKNFHFGNFLHCSCFWTP